MKNKSETATGIRGTAIYETGVILAVFLAILWSMSASANPQTQTSEKKMAHKVLDSSWAVSHKSSNGEVAYRRKGELVVTYNSESDKKKKRTLPGGMNIKKGNIAHKLDNYYFDEKTMDVSSAIEAIKKLPGVKHVEPNTVYKHQFRQLAQKQWHLNKIRKARTQTNKVNRGERQENVQQLTKAYTQSKSRMCILDTGIDYRHPDLAANVVAGVNILNSDNDEMDENGHGTMVAGVIAALDNDIGVTGVNPNVSVCAIKVLNSDGIGTLENVVKGVQWAIDNNIPLINMSFGSYEYSAILEEIIDQYIQSGGVVVASAGNDYVPDLTYPAKYAAVISVGSHDEGGWISQFSNWGSQIDVFSPGNMLLTTGLSDNENTLYADFSGTSSAAAFTSGIVTLMLNQGMHASEIAASLKAHTYRKYSAYNPRQDYFSVLNAEALVAMLNHKKYRALTISRFVQDKTYTNAADSVEFSAEIVNTGTLPSKRTDLRLISYQGENKREVVLGEIPVIKPGEQAELTTRVSVDELVGNSADSEPTQLTLKPYVQEQENSEHEKSILFVNTDTGQKVKVLSMWMSPLNFEDLNVEPELHFYVKNIGNSQLENYRANIYYVEADHEGVSKGESVTIDSDYALTPLLPGESQEFTVPLSGIAFHEGPVSFVTEIMAENVIGERFIQSYRTTTPVNRVKTQYAQKVHRNIADDAIKYLAAKNVYIPDLHASNASYRGNRNSYNSWPESLGLPTASMKVDGYWTDSSLNTFSSFFGGLNYTFIDGAHDADGVDIAYGYTWEDNFDSHFWFVDNSDDDGLNSSGSNHHSALYKLRALLFGGWSSQIKYGAISHYKAGYKKAAWWFMGHAAHLIGDLSLPSHVNNENSHGVYGATYHNWMDGGGYSNYNYLDAVSQGGLIDPYNSNTGGDPVRYLAYTTAQLGNAFPWASTWNATYYGKSGNRVAGGNYPHYDSVMNGLFASIPYRPTAQWHVNKDEVIDTCADWLCRDECQRVDWVSYKEYHSDCYDKDGHKDYDNTDDGGSNNDGDMARIAQYNYPYAVRAVASLAYYFAKEAGALDYCPSKGTNTSFEWVDSVAIDGLVKTSGNNSGYANHTSNNWTLGRNWHQVTLTPGFSSGSYVENWRVWIDLNQNFIYEDNELLVSTSASSAQTVSFQIPSTAKKGYTRMRVSMQWGGTPSACSESFTYGEVEDFKLYLY